MLTALGFAHSLLLVHSALYLYTHGSHCIVPLSLYTHFELTTWEESAFQYAPNRKGRSGIHVQSGISGYQCLNIWQFLQLIILNSWVHQLYRHANFLLRPATLPSLYITFQTMTFQPCLTGVVSSRSLVKSVHLPPIFNCSCMSTMSSHKAHSCYIICWLSTYDKIMWPFPGTRQCWDSNAPHTSINWLARQQLL